MAWNASLVEGSRQAALIDQLKDNVVSGSGPAEGENFEQLMRMLMVRKALYFADNKRYILDYRVSETKQEYRVAVVSRPQPGWAEPSINGIEGDSGKTP